MPKKKRRVQCASCPWRVDTDPFNIPDGYCPTRHADLKNTIADPLDQTVYGELRMMACHLYKKGREMPCVGWLMNQLGVGNNIRLRFAVMRGHVNADVELVGEQHQTLEDTLP